MSIYCIYEESNGRLHSSTRNPDFTPLPEGLAYVELDDDPSLTHWDEQELVLVKAPPATLFRTSKFMSKLGLLSMSKLIEKGKTDSMVAAFLEYIRAGSVVDTEDPEYLAGVAYVVGEGVLTTSDFERVL